MTFRKLVLALGLAPAFVACSSSATSTDSSEAPIVTDFPASFCEVFIEDIAIHQGNSGALGPRFFVKTLNTRLDAPIEQVAFFGRIVQDGSNFFTIRAQPFPGADDFWTFDLPTSNDARTLSWEGSVFVRTRSGKTLWANAKSD